MKERKINAEIAQFCLAAIESELVQGIVISGFNFKSGSTIRVMTIYDTQDVNSVMNAGKRHDLVDKYFNRLVDFEHPEVAFMEIGIPFDTYFLAQHNNFMEKDLMSGEVLYDPTGKLETFKEQLDKDLVIQPWADSTSVSSLGFSDSLVTKIKTKVKK